MSCPLLRLIVTKKAVKNLRLLRGVEEIDCPDISCEITEDWSSKHSEPYHKVLELYCLHVLPHLGKWEYVREFLSYENKLLFDKKCVILNAMMLGTIFRTRSSTWLSAREYKVGDTNT
ncbi:hypothetical protein DFH29DRAFT_874611 [Suillus ampliporus]|nr:hypothetical protein DFH29DRAFT_874611 [Suillus ampliporus]